MPKKSRKWKGKKCGEAGGNKPDGGRDSGVVLLVDGKGESVTGGEKLLSQREEGEDKDLLENMVGEDASYNQNILEMWTFSSQQSGHEDTGEIAVRSDAKPGPVALQSAGDTRTLECNPGGTRTLECNPGDTRTLECNPGDTRTLECNPGDTRTLECNPGDTVMLNRNSSNGQSYKGDDSESTGRLLASLKIINKPTSKTQLKHKQKKNTNRKMNSDNELEKAKTDRAKLQEKVNLVPNIDQKMNDNRSSGDKPAVVVSQLKTIQMKHPLQKTWTFWYRRGVNTSEQLVRWEALQHKISDVSTIEDFWAVFNHLEEVIALNPGCDYSVFVKGIYPCWDDFLNRNGGRWVIAQDPKFRIKLQQNWLEILLLLIGETAEPHLLKQINGAVVSVRDRMDKLSVWVSDASSRNLDAIAELIRRKLHFVNCPFTLQFSKHMKDSKKSYVGGMDRNRV